MENRSITNSFKGTANQIRENMPSLKVGDDNPGKKPKNFVEDPDVAKLKKYALYGLTGAVLVVAALLILVEIFKRFFG